MSLPQKLVAVVGTVEEVVPAMVHLEAGTPMVLTVKRLIAISPAMETSTIMAFEFTTRKSVGF